MTTETLIAGEASTDAGSQSTAEATGTAPLVPATEQSTTTEGTSTEDATSGETKPEGETKEGESDGDKKPEGAPEQYEDFAAPEGVKLDAEATAEFKELAKGLNLSQEDAQKVVDLGPKLMQKWSEQQQSAIADTVAKWADDTRADKEIGGDKLTETLAVAKTARDSFATPALVTLLNESGLGNHPEVIRMFAKVGKAISEDSRMVSGNAAPAEKPGDPKSFYPNSNMN